ncbi:MULTISPECIES: nitrogen regulation protein NR(II) [unclassified Shewanella]|uniref:nitrogen regulation protein NR(II) n=1 Tax=unclassified Shewanella TaxID=196818 RepID=UPI000C83FBB5|nr:MULTISPECIES: nitrogen regulation protein NR(II) [unclassified Shewanella]MDO6618448.1 nitrogen regulation protein NR(II) [Shewanella sp. 6_MG-2023]MDO6640265.1 nitrogen regulation protein NR(II) [Shewanella sp. 5_MG-2023]MDO6679657.1 nitrogen regulation protein NR(II) [Shewanella sp. 4_MG-2023]MDO6774424.1 nitrogen regulation protein NR(II) [Shewanella sp. 3_MG-2023]PMG28893.1 two-component system sensor histidine kinase NtrB [Shewanella sp. 10N.286.52.C2]
MDMNNLLNHLVTAVFVIDNELRPRYANAAAEQLLGIGSNKLLEQRLPELYQFMGVEAELLQDSVNANQGITVNTAALITLDGVHHIIDITLIPMESEDNISLLELRQVDQQHRIHQQLNLDAQQQAAQFLVRNLAHEIKNPLGGLRGAAQLLSRELEDPSLKEFTDLIIEQADRLRNLVDKLLGPQRPTQHETHNIHQIVQKVLRLVELTLPSNIRLERDYDPSIPDMDMDADQLQQAVLNVVQNAAQALDPNGGEILIRTRTQHQVTIGTKRFKLVLALSIIDNGPGIPADLLDTLFYPMVTGREEGSGLGLSIAHNIARLHGGRIDCISAPGQTEFTIILPLQ